MIVQFEPNRILLSNPAQWWLGYKQEDEVHFHWTSVTYTTLKLFLENYGYETNDILSLIYAISIPFTISCMISISGLYGRSLFFANIFLPSISVYTITHIIYYTFKKYNKIILL